MRSKLCGLVVLLAAMTPAALAAKGGSHSGGSHSSGSHSSSRSHSSGGTVHVRGYTRKDGTVVRAHDRAAPGSRGMISGSGFTPRTTYRGASSWNNDEDDIAPQVAYRTEARTAARSLTPRTESKPKVAPQFTAHFASGRRLGIVSYEDLGDKYVVRTTNGGESSYPKSMIDSFEALPVAEESSSLNLVDDKTETVAVAKPSKARAPPKTLTGKVVHVADGDTLTILDEENAQHKIRLNGIDAPESGQAFGSRAKQALSGKVFGKSVSVQTHGNDKYRRTIGDVLLGNRLVNLEMVEEGLAWHYKEHSKSKDLADAEVEARRLGVGLWADADPQPPWEFRQQSKETTAR